MFTDMVGYTDLMSRDEALAIRLRHRHRDVLTRQHSAHSGEILQYFGDGTVSLFDSAVNAIRCAIDIQLELQEDPPVPLRIGIHSGEVVWDKEVVFGNAVNIASRVESLAPTGSILVSAKILEEVSNHPDLSFQSVGRFTLKNVPAAMELLAVVHPELPVADLSAIRGKGEMLEEEGTQAVGNSENHAHEDEWSTSIAVLPFTDLSEDRDQEYLCDGLADEIITDLSGLQTLKVIARHSSTQLKGTQLGVREIGRTLGVEYLLTGSVMKAGDRLRITAQLVQAGTDRQVWGDKYRGGMEDIFDLQETISKQIISSLDLTLSRGDEQRITRRPIEDIRAYDAYLRARREIFRLTGESLDTAHRLIDQAVELIGPNALLISTRGMVNVSYVVLGIRPDPVYLAAAEKDLDTLTAVNPETVYRYLLRGLIRYKQARIPEAVEDLEKVVQYDPNNRDGLLYLGILRILAGQAARAATLFERLVEVDPLTAVNHIMPGYARFAAGDLSGAVSFYRRAYEMEPNNPMLILMMGIVPGRIEPPEKTIPILAELEKIAPDSFFGRVGRFLRLSLAGKRDEALEAGEDEQLQLAAATDEHAA